MSKPFLGVIHMTTDPISAGDICYCLEAGVDVPDAASQSARRDDKKLTKEKSRSSGQLTSFPTSQVALTHLSVCYHPDV